MLVIFPAWEEQRNIHGKLRENTAGWHVIMSLGQVMSVQIWVWGKLNDSLNYLYIKLWQRTRWGRTRSNLTSGKEDQEETAARQRGFPLWNAFLEFALEQLCVPWLLYTFSALNNVQYLKHTVFPYEQEFNGSQICFCVKESGFFWL